MLSITPSHHRLPRAFSLLETVVVLGLIALLAIAVLPNLDVEQGASDNSRAQGTLETTLDSQILVKDATGSFADPAVGLSRLQDTKPEVTFVGPDTVSNDSRVVSVALPAPDVVLAASLGDKETCWVSRRDFAAPAGSPVAVHAYVDLSPSGPVGATCSAGYALTLFTAPVLAELGAATGTSPGISWQRPYELR